MGSLSLKKQNLSTLKPYFIIESGETNSENTYIFKYAFPNILANIFYYAQFVPYIDSISIYTQGNLDGVYSSFYSDGNKFVYEDYTTNANNYVIPDNSLLRFSTSYNINITVSFGVIIQKYYQGKTSIKKQNLGGGKLISNQNYILNSKFDADNQYPIADGTRFFDNNYYPEGHCGGQDTCTILTNYRHNSPLLYSPYEFDYHTFANRTFHEINAPYDILPIGHPIQPRLLKMFGVGSKFGRTQSISTIINTESFVVTPPDNTSWTKYGVEQIVTIPSWATKVVYGVKYLAKSDDLFRENNFAGLKLNFRLLDEFSERNYVNVHLIRGSTAAAVDTLESLYGSNIYRYFNASLGTAASNQWLGPNIGTVKIRKRSSTIIDSNTNQFIKIKDTIDIPTFSSSGAEPDFGNGRPDTVSLEMFFAEWVSYFVSSGPNETLSGSIYFYEPFIYFI